MALALTDGSQLRMEPEGPRIIRVPEVLPPAKPSLVKRCAAGCGKPVSQNKRLCKACRDLSLQQLATRIGNEEMFEKVLSQIDPDDRKEAEQLMRPYLNCEISPPIPDCPDCGLKRGSVTEHQCAQRIAREFAAQTPDQAALDKVLDAEPNPAKRAVLVEYLKPYLSFTPAEDTVAIEDCPKCGFRRGTILSHECILPS